MKRKAAILAGAVLGVMAARADAAASLLYQWNFDDNGGTGSTVTPAVTPNNLSSDGGTLTLATGTALTASNALYSASGGGYTGQSGDFSFNNSNSTISGASNSGVAYTTSTNLLAAMPTTEQYTLTMWLNPTTAELAAQSRLFQVATVNNYDEFAGAAGNGLWVALNNGKIQAGGGPSAPTYTLTSGVTDGNTGGVGSVLVANVWNFIAIEMDFNATTGVSTPTNDTAMQTANGQNDSYELYEGNTTSNTYGFTYGAGFANQSITLDSTDNPTGDYVQLLDRTVNMSRPYQGYGDDFQIYNGLLSTAQLQALAAVPEPGNMGLLVTAAGALLYRRRRSDSAVKATAQI